MPYIVKVVLLFDPPVPNQMQPTEQVALFKYDLANQQMETAAYAKQDCNPNSSGYGPVNLQAVAGSYKMALLDRKYGTVKFFCFENPDAVYVANSPQNALVVTVCSADVTVDFKKPAG